MDQRVFEQCGKSMVRLHYGGAFHGSGPVVRTSHNECMVMTCGHVVRGLREGENVNAYLSGENEPFKCAEIFWDPVTDLALLQNLPCDRSFNSVTPLKFFEAEPVALQADIVLLAFYSLDDDIPMLQPGTSTGNIIAEPRGGEIVYSASSQPGTSGGAVICSRDGAEFYVAGVHARTDQTTCYAASVETIAGFLLDWVNSTRRKKEDIGMVDIKRMLEMGPRLSNYDDAKKLNVDDDKV